MTTSLLDAHGDSLAVRGVQRPRILWVPPYVSTTGPEAIELVGEAGLDLDDWQQFALSESLGEQENGKWSAFEVGELVSRQNGKGGLLEARELTGLYLLGERLIIHSAHQFDTSLEAFRRLLALIEDHRPFLRRVKRVSNAHGNEGIELTTGQRIRFRTRTKGGGRGFTADCLVLDEAMDIPEATHAALLPTLSARPNPQVWYTGSAVDQEVDDNGVVFARIRERGMKGGDPSLAYFEHSADLTIDKITREDTANPKHWADANPALGIRISMEHVERERLTLSTRKFAVERLGVGDWPRTDDEADRVITMEAWNTGLDATSEMRKPITLAFDVKPDSSMAAIGAAGDRRDGNVHCQVIEHELGTSWVAERLAELYQAYKPWAIVCNPVGPALSLVPEIEELLGVEVKKITAREYAQACGLVLNGVKDRTLKHLIDDELDAAVDGAGTRPLGDAWAWSWPNSSADISPLAVITLAVWGNSTKPKKPKSRVVDLAAALAADAEAHK